MEFFDKKTSSQQSNYNDSSEMVFKEIDEHQKHQSQNSDTLRLNQE